MTEHNKDDAQNQVMYAQEELKHSPNTLCKLNQRRCMHKPRCARLEGLTVIEKFMTSAAYKFSSTLSITRFLSQHSFSIY